MNEELSIMSMVDTLLKKWYVLFIAAIVGGIFAFTYTDIFVAPKYSAGTTLYVNARDMRTEELSTATITASQQLVNTYAEILKAKDFLNKIVRDLDGKYTAEQIRGMLSMSAVNETEVLSVRVIGTDREDVYDIAMRLVEYSTDELKNVVGAGSVTILETPTEPEAPVSPNVRRNTLLGVILGLGLAGLIVVVLDLLDTRIKSSEEFVNTYEEPLLGEIPTLEEVQIQESRGR